MADPYEIPFESAESVKNLVGKHLIVKGRSLHVKAWEGKNLIISDPVANQEGPYPAMWVLDQIKRGKMTVA